MTFVRHVYDNGYTIEYNGNEIYRQTGPATWPNEDAISAIIDEANVSTPLKEVLMALLVDVDKEHHDGAL